MTDPGSVSWFHFLILFADRSQVRIPWSFPGSFRDPFPNSFPKAYPFKNMRCQGANIACSKVGLHNVLDQKNNQLVEDS